MSRTAIVLFNLGGPDSLAAVEPFLVNLFSDPAIIALPKPLRVLAGAAHRAAARERGAAHLCPHGQWLAAPRQYRGAGACS